LSFKTDLIAALP